LEGDGEFSTPELPLLAVSPQPSPTAAFAERILGDLGFVPSFADWVRTIRPEPWMGRAQPIHKLVDPFAVAA
jgi:hypothetical protein